MMGIAVKRTIRRLSEPHEVIRYDRDTTEFIDGVAQPLEQETETIKIHVQPIGSGNLIASLPEGQRQTDVKKGWTLDSIRKKDQLVIGDYLFTVNAIQDWPKSKHIECDLIRSGEADNHYES